jgi:hypothetical protein
MRIVVVDIDGRLGQTGAEIGHHFGDSGFLVVAGHQDGDSELGEPIGRNSIGIEPIIC